MGEFHFTALCAGRHADGHTDCEGKPAVLCCPEAAQDLLSHRQAACGRGGD